METQQLTLDSQKNSVFNAAVIVAALGYFVDIYDLILFSIVRIPSLTALGYGPEEVLKHGILLLNMQMVGMLIGGIFWGILGDKKGRLSILFGSIILYSLANIANAFVTSVESYAVLRFIAGVGLAGELGAGITLVTEIMSKESRGYGTMLVATVGVAGAVAASIIAKYFDWQTCYLIGGALGLALLVLRMIVAESGMFNYLKQQPIQRGNFFSLFTNRKRFTRYLQCILIGMPLWFVVGILITFAPEFAKALNISGPVEAGNAVMYCYIGCIAGDFLCGLISQLWQSRKKAMQLFLFINLVSIVSYFFLYNVSPTVFYMFCVLLGFSIGFWSVFVTIAAEQFGTNLRATVTTTVPNFVRGTLPLLTLIFLQLKTHVGIMTSGLIVGIGCVTIALIALHFKQETFNKDLNYYES